MKPTREKGEEMGITKAWLVRKQGQLLAHGNTAADCVTADCGCEDEDVHRMIEALLGVIEECEVTEAAYAGFESRQGRKSSHVVVRGNARVSTANILQRVKQSPTTKG